MAKGDIVIIDTETTGLQYGTHMPFELSWLKWDKELFRDTGGVSDEVHTLFLPLPGDVIEDADPMALELNGWTKDRLIEESFKVIHAGYEPFSEAVEKFLLDVKGSTIMGANVRFDARMLEYAFMLDEEPWHHRLFDIQAYFAGTVGMDEMPGMNDIFEWLRENNPLGTTSITAPDHTSANDVRAVRDIYRECLILNSL